MVDRVRSALGARLRELRRGKSLTLRALAVELGLDFTYLSKVEAGSDIPGEATLRAMAKLYEVPPDELLGLAGKVPTELPGRAREDPRLGRLLRVLPGLPAQQLDEVLRAAGIQPKDQDPE